MSWQGHKKEIREREETIADKEKRIYDLKKKNQEVSSGVTLLRVTAKSCSSLPVELMRWTLVDHLTARSNPKYQRKDAMLRMLSGSRLITKTLFLPWVPLLVVDTTEFFGVYSFGRWCNAKNVSFRVDFSMKRRRKLRSSLQYPSFFSIFFDVGVTADLPRHVDDISLENIPIFRQMPNAHLLKSSSGWAKMNLKAYYKPTCNLHAKVTRLPNERRAAVAAAAIADLKGEHRLEVRLCTSSVYTVDV